MKKINPSDLVGARIYFTGFDNKSYVTTNQDEKLKILKRTLKVLLLTKNKVIFGASHLRSDLAIKIFNESPEIFERNIIIPALRNDHNGNLENVTNEKLNINSISSYVGWDLLDNTKWFKEQIFNGFKFNNSLLRNNLKYTSTHNFNKIIDLIDESKYLNRNITKNIEKYLDLKDVESFNKYQNLVYNVSGARVVNCESSLDQENMIFDYSLTDIKDKKVFLSDVEIFHRIFVEQTLNILHRNNSMFNVSFIDALNFNDVLDLREKIDNNNFIEKYNQIIEKSSNLIKKQDFIDFHSLEELLSISENLYKNFNIDIESEANKYLKNKKQYQKDKSIWEPVYNIVKSLNPMTSYIEEGQNLIHLTRNIYNNLTSDKEENVYKHFLNDQTEIAKLIIKNRQLDNSTSLIETLKLIQNYTYEKYSNF
jgi:hypothetical protein